MVPPAATHSAESLYYLPELERNCSGFDKLSPVPECERIIRDRNMTPNTALPGQRDIVCGKTGEGEKGDSGRSQEARSTAKLLRALQGTGIVLLPNPICTFPVKPDLPTATLSVLKGWRLFITAFGEGNGTERGINHPDIR
ncbi:unnamed protein product [Leuciscus chuanchicus]